VSVSLVALAVIADARWRRVARFPALRVGITAGFAVLTLGPFLGVGGVNTHVPRSHRGASGATPGSACTAAACPWTRLRRPASCRPSPTREA